MYCLQGTRRRPLLPVRDQHGCMSPDQYQISMEWGEMVNVPESRAIYLETTDTAVIGLVRHGLYPVSFTLAL